MELWVNLISPVSQAAIQQLLLMRNRATKYVDVQGGRMGLQPPVTVTMEQGHGTTPATAHNLTPGLILRPAGAHIPAPQGHLQPRAA